MCNEYHQTISPESVSRHCLPEIVSGHRPPGIGIFGNISNPCETKAAIAASGNDSFLLFYSILERLHFIVLTLLSH